MPAPQAPTTAPNLLWERGQTLTKSPKRKGNPLIVMAVAAMVVLAVSGVWRAMHEQKPTKMVKVISASHDIAAGTKVGFSMVKFEEVPKMYVTPDMVTSLAWSTGRTTRTFIPAGEPLRADDLFHDIHGVSGTLETHERAITLQLPDDAMVDHSISPDDLVDILVVTTKDGKKFTKTIMQQARVLVVASKEQAMSRQNSSGANKITLAVTPDLAESLTEASETGRLRLVLRNRLSHTQPQLAGVQEEDLLPASAFSKHKPWQTADVVAVPPPPPPPKFALPAIPEPAALLPPQVTAPLEWVVEVFSGTKKESYGVPAR